MKNIQSFDLIVIGGGITGLATAYIAAKAGKKVAIIEATNTIGGLLSTFETQNTRLEYFYHHFFTHDAELNWLITELKINKSLHYSKTTMAVFVNGKIFNFNSIWDVLKFTPISFFDTIRFVVTSIFMGKFANWKKYESISAIQWLNTWVGKSTSAFLWNPLLQIKFGPHASKVPLSWMIGRMRQRINSRKNGDEKLGYIDGSLQVLLDALSKKLEKMKVSIYTNSPITEISIQDKKILHITSTDTTYIASQYIFTIPNFIISKLFENTYPEISKSLNSIEYFGVLCVVLELDKPLSSIYWMNIAEKNFPFGGIIEHTNFISASKYNNTHIVYLSRYFAINEEISSMSNSEVEALFIPFLSKVNPNFDTSWIKKVRTFRTNTAAIVCDIDFSKKIPACKMDISNAYIANMSHIYPDERSINNSIRVAAEACKVMEIENDLPKKSNSLSAKIGFTI